MTASLSLTSQTAEGTAMANGQTLKTCKNDDLAKTLCSDNDEELDESVMVDLQSVSEQLQRVPTVYVCCVLILMLQVTFFQISLVAFAFSGRSELLT